MEADLKKDEHLIETISVDDIGNFVFSELPPGIYELIIRTPEAEMVISELKVGPVT